MGMIDPLLAEIRSIKSSPKDLRSFGRTLGTFCALVALWLVWHHRDAWVAWLGVAVFLLVSAQFEPRLLKAFQKTWMGIAMAMGWCMTPVILGVLFYLILTPVSLLMRCMGKDTLDTPFRDGKPSYWRPRSSERHSIEDYERQF